MNTEIHKIEEEVIKLYRDKVVTGGIDELLGRK